MVDFKVGDKVRLTGEEWRTARPGEPQHGDVYTARSVDEDGDAVIAEGEWWAYSDGSDGDWTATVVERDGRVIPEALLPGDVVMSEGAFERTVLSVQGRLVTFDRGGLYDMEYGYFWRTVSFVRPATSKPDEPSLQEQIQQMAKDMAPIYERMVEREQEHLLAWMDDLADPLHVGPADEPPPRCADVVGSLWVAPARATSIADAALRGLPYEVDMREEYAEANAWCFRERAFVHRRGDKPQDADGWAEARAAELRESLESEARRTLREWPTRAGVPLRLAVRGDAGLFTATWEE